jgi:hypothetical protein
MSSVHWFDMLEVEAIVRPSTRITREHPLATTVDLIHTLIVYLLPLSTVGFVARSMAPKSLFVRSILR